MQGLDTNVLVRYLTQDDPEQSALAAAAIEQPDAVFLIQPIVLCELVWVLDSAYRFSKLEILTALEQILRTAQFEVARKDTVWKSVAGFRRDKGDFADYFIGEANLSDGAVSTLTFDKALRSATGFRLLEAKGTAS